MTRIIYIQSTADHVVPRYSEAPLESYPHAMPAEGLGAGPFYVRSGVLYDLPKPPPELMTAAPPPVFDIAAEAWVDTRTPGEIAAAAVAALAAERAAMVPYVRAWRAALKLLPAPGYAHLLDRIEDLIASARALDPYADLVIWADSVTQIERDHPDIEGLGALVGLSPVQIDAICRLALAIEAGADPATIAALVADYLAA